MPIRIISTGNILADDAEAIVVPVNTVGVPGAGLALAAARRWPCWAKNYKDACFTHDLDEAGDVVLHRNLDSGPAEWIVSVATKGHFREKSSLDKIQAGLQNLARILRDHHFKYLAIPALGCGLGGLDWNTVRPLIEAAFASTTADVRLFTPREGG